MSRGCDRWHIWPVVTKTQPAGVEDRKADKLSLREDLRALYKQGGEGAGMIEINYPLSIRSDFGYCAHVAPRLRPNCLLINASHPLERMATELQSDGVRPRPASSSSWPPELIERIRKSKAAPYMETNKGSQTTKPSSSSPNTTVTSVLEWDVFLTPGLPIVTPDRPPGIRKTYFQAMASTLIYGNNDAVLVDAFMTVKQANALADWVASKARNLTTVYITHGHGDHWFGVGTLLERFPNARVVATPNTVKVMRQNASPEALNGAWKPGFPGQIPDKLVIAEELDGNVIDLEGHKLVVVELGHTDTDHTTCLNVPSIGLVVAGDAAYNDVHLYLAESNAATRQEWIAALDKIQSLNPRAVIASHKQPDSDDNPRIIEETRQYIRDFDRLAAAATNAQELYDKMMELYPNRINPGWALWSSARAVKA